MRLDEVQELSEVRNMLAEQVMEWTEDWKQQGLQEGLHKGMKQGEAALLQRLLERKFRPLDEATRAKLAEADADILLVWGERVLETESLAAVFRD